MRIYIAGPMTGLPEFNYPAFHEAARRLRELGHEVLNPAENPEPPCKSWQGYMRMALAQLVTCDAVALLDGWEQSKGARIEFRTAADLGLHAVPIAQLDPRYVHQLPGFLSLKEPSYDHTAAFTGPSDAARDLRKALGISQDFADWPLHKLMAKAAERIVALSAAQASKPTPSDPVHGDVLPAVGSRVFILHGRDDDAHACRVTGYYAWPDLGGNKRLSRVFVHLVYEGSTNKQARMLCDCHPSKEAALAYRASKQAAPAAPSQWIERWFGSGDERGWWIYTIAPYPGEPVSRLGPDAEGDQVRAIVKAHNEALLAAPAAPSRQPLTDGQCDALIDEWADPAGLTADFVNDIRGELRTLVRASTDWNANRLDEARANLAAHGITGEAAPAAPGHDSAAPQAGG